MSRSSAGSELGTSTVDLLATLLVVASTASMALGVATANVEAARSMGAARYLASVLREARALAVTRSACVAVRVRTVATEDEIELFADGNGNGVRTADIQAGIDRSLRPAETLSTRFAGVRFGVAETVPGVDGEPALDEGSDPLRVGSSGLVSFSPTGGASSGTLYVTSREGHQSAVRVLGATGRARVLEFERGSRIWRDR